jgi:hypothetical protein
MGVLTAWMAVVAAIGVRSVRGPEHRVPTPGELIPVSMLYGGLGLLAQANAKVAGLLAWGFVIAVVVQAGGPQQLLAGQATPTAFPPVGGGAKPPKGRPPQPATQIF